MQTNLIDSLPVTAWQETTHRSGERDASSVDAKTWGAVGSMAMCVSLLIAGIGLKLRAERAAAES